MGMAEIDTEMAGLAGPCNRRGFIARCVAAPVVAAGGIGLNAAVAAGSIKTFKGRYAIDSHRIVEGYFAAPRGAGKLDVVLVIPRSGTLDAAAETMARGYAADGYLAIAPNLPTSYRAAALGGKQSMVAALLRDMPRMKRLAQGSGKVVVVAA